MTSEAIRASDTAANRQHLIALLRREAAYSGVWFADKLNEAADIIAAEARSHDGEWEAMRERCAKACENLPWGDGDAQNFDDTKHACAEAIRSLSAVPLFDEGRL